MFTFACPRCREELEAEDSIRGTRMACPQCGQRISIPRNRAWSSGGDAQGGPPRVLVVVVAVATLFLIAGAFWGRMVVTARRAEARGPECVKCQGTRQVKCATCKGEKTQRCPNDKCDKGQSVNSRGTLEQCFSCNGRGAVRCQTCAGVGAYACPVCVDAGAR
ncbi:MAG: hypothetical protein HYY16_15500 [Planctomycetes bacterium]|nr:hypothetical protein [Planctomycetota bacterium]